MSLVIFWLLFSSIDYIPGKGEIIWYLSLSAWLISLSSIHDVMKGRSSFFSFCCVVFHCVNVPQCFDPLIFWWAPRCFQYLAIVNCAAINIEVHSSCWLVFQSSYDIISAGELLALKAVPFLVFWGNSILLSTVAFPVCIPTNSALGFPFLRILSNICLCWPLWLVWDGTSLWF